MLPQQLPGEVLLGIRGGGLNTGGTPALPAVREEELEPQAESAAAPSEEAAPTKKIRREATADRIMVDYPF